MFVWPKDRLTRFEVARIIGARSLQISLGAPLLVKSTKADTDPMEMAEREFMEAKVPMTIKRVLPNGEVVIVDIKAGIKNWIEEHNGKIF